MKIPARTLAVDALDNFDVNKGQLAEYLRSRIDKTEQKAFCTDIAFGVVRNLSAIDLIISQAGTVRINNINKKVLNVLRMGVYELVYTGSEADYAIVNEAVELAGSRAGKKAGGFVNAILRQTQRHIVRKNQKLEKVNAKRILPTADGVGCEFDTDILPEPMVNQGGYLSSAFSLPEWLVQGWIDDFGYDETFGICIGCNRRPSVYLRLNSLKTNAKKLAELFRKNEIDFEVSTDSEIFRVRSKKAVPQLPGFKEGLFVVQDIAASKVVKSLDLTECLVVLDLCAAPGGKTMQIAEALGNKGVVIATDINSARLKKVSENCQRLDVKNVNIVEYGKLDKALMSYPDIDMVLLDVPCSNSGVLARRVEARWRLRPTSIKSITEIQKQILNKARSIVKTGGVICYSTCSIEKNENTEVIKSFLAANPEFKLESESLTLPSAKGFDCDGGYFAVLKKIKN